MIEKYMREKGKRELSLVSHTNPGALKKLFRFLEKNTLPRKKHAPFLKKKGGVFF
jgi:hypothetical protein